MGCWRMSEEIFKILLEEFKRNGVKLIGHDFRCDVFISDPADIVHETFERQCTTIPQLLDFSEHDKVFEDKITDQKNEISILKSLIDNYRDAESKLFDENKELKQRIAELESELEKKECIKTMRIEFHADNGEMLTPLEVANSLINQKTFKVDELRELAEHLEVYCRHNRQRCDEPIAF